jgi:FemAB-related protein (PEP-CTERM system-associated)
MSLQVSELTPDLAPRWDEFVRCHPCGTPFHTTAWRAAIESTFRYRPLYRAVTGGGRIHAVVPLFLTEGVVTGRVLISSPFAVYGGILADSEESRDLLGEHVAAIGREFRAQYIELRNARPEQCLGWNTVERYVTFTRPVCPPDPERLLDSLPKKTRNMVRKALKTPFEVVRVWDTRRFERLHSLTLRRLGTPSFPPRHFSSLVRYFGRHVDVCEVWHGGRLAAASMSFIFRGEMHIYYAATNPELNHLAPNYRMYFDHLLWAGRLGCSVFDFGRSKLNTGTFDFKRHWGTEMRPLPYEVLLLSRKEMPNFSPSNENFLPAIRLWRKLPLAITRRLGPRLVRLFP